jgi:uncharacterized protein YggL (DUF469 family)
MMSLTGAMVDKCKERNRDHARKTRLRKKVALDSMKERIGQLQSEVRRIYSFQCQI